MLALNDPRWRDYVGGYGLPYDASVALRKLFTAGASEAIWQELWNELHHQGDLGAASYAAVPHLVEFVRTQAKLNWNALALIAVIELERPKNPPVPAELSHSYFQSIAHLPGVLAAHPDKQWDDLIMQGAAVCIALARGHLNLSLGQGLKWLDEETGYEPEKA